MKAIFLLNRRSKSHGEATTDFVQGDPFHVGEAPHCPSCGGPVGMLAWEQPLRAELETWGSQFGDLAFGPGPDILVSERFKDLWQKSGLIGLVGFERVEVIKVVRRGKRFEDSPPPYVRVVPQRSRTAFDSVASGEEWLQPPSPRCEECREGGNSKGWARIVLEEEPKENIFMVRGLGSWVLVDEHFKRFCETHAITNCPLIPAEQASHWF